MKSRGFKLLSIEGVTNLWWNFHFENQKPLLLTFFVTLLFLSCLDHTFYKAEHASLNQYMIRGQTHHLNSEMKPIPFSNGAVFPQSSFWMFGSVTARRVCYGIHTQLNMHINDKQLGAKHCRISSLDY